MPLSNAEVVILNDNARFSGGASSVALQSAIELADRGIGVTLFASTGPVASELQNRAGLNVVSLGQHDIADDPNRLRAFVQGVWNGRAIGKLAHLLGSKDPARTVVHVHTWMKALSPGVLAAVLNRGFRVALTLHDFFAVCPSGGFYVHRKREICARRPLSLSCLRCNCDRRIYPHKLWRFARTALQNGWLRVAARIHHYIGVSQFSVDVIKRYLPQDAPITIVRNPIDCHDAGPSSVRENRSFVFVGRFVSEKGVEVFAEAAERTGLPAMFIGGGELESALKRRCPQARFPGWLSAREATFLLRQARALVFPSLWYETLGLSAIEAMANGVPVIVSDRCAASEFVKHEHSGLHFQNGSVDSLMTQMRRLTDANLAAQLGQSGYDWYWRDPWTRAAHADGLLSVYRSILNSAA